MINIYDDTFYNYIDSEYRIDILKQITIITYDIIDKLTRSNTDYGKNKIIQDRYNYDFNINSYNITNNYFPKNDHYVYYISINNIDYYCIVVINGVLHIIKLDLPIGIINIEYNNGIDRENLINEIYGIYKTNDVNNLNNINNDDSANSMEIELKNEKMDIRTMTAMELFNNINNIIKKDEHQYRNDSESDNDSKSDNDNNKYFLINDIKYNMSNKNIDILINDILTINKKLFIIKDIGNIDIYILYKNGYIFSYKGNLIYNNILNDIYNVFIYNPDIDNLQQQNKKDKNKIIKDTYKIIENYNIYNNKITIKINNDIIDLNNDFGYMDHNIKYEVNYISQNNYFVNHIYTLTKNKKIDNTTNNELYDNVITYNIDSIKKYNNINNLNIPNIDYCRLLLYKIFNSIFKGNYMNIYKHISIYKDKNDNIDKKIIMYMNENYYHKLFYNININNTIVNEKIKIFNNIINKLSLSISKYYINIKKILYDNTLFSILNNFIKNGSLTNINLLYDYLNIYFDESIFNYNLDGDIFTNINLDNLIVYILFFYTKKILNNNGFEIKIFDDNFEYNTIFQIINYNHNIII